MRPHKASLALATLIAALAGGSAIDRASAWVLRDDGRSEPRPELFLPRSAGSESARRSMGGVDRQRPSRVAPSRAYSSGGNSSDDGYAQDGYWGSSLRTMGGRQMRGRSSRMNGGMRGRR
jgi:hypothetical protein